MSNQPTCEETISGYMASRLGHIGAINDLADVQDVARLDEITEDKQTRDVLDEYGIDAKKLQEAREGESGVFDEINDAASDARQSLPLAVSSKIMHRIDLGTGGPADWLEFLCDGNDVERITYHYADWFDHAERVLESGSFEYQAALAFAEYVIPDLIE